MYTENGITYVEGIEEVFMGYFLKYHPERYKFKVCTRTPTDEDRARVKRLKMMVQEARRKKQQLKAEAELVAKQEAELLAKQEAKAASVVRTQLRKKKYYQEHIEYFSQKAHERYVRVMKEKHGDNYRAKKMTPQKSKYPSNTKEYKHEYYLRHKERIKQLMKEKRKKQCEK